MSVGEHNYVGRAHRGGEAEVSQVFGGEASCSHRLSCLDRLTYILEFLTE